MKSKFLTLLFLLLISLPLVVIAQNQVKPAADTNLATVTTAVPVLDLIANALLEKTPISVVYLPPKRLPINRIPAWLNKTGSNELAVTDAVLTIESVWKDLAVFPLLRQKNIRLVAIDLAQEIAPGGAGISQREGISEPDYFWLESNNLLLMINIAARDLARLWPEHAQQISHNRVQALRQIQQMALQIDELLLLANVNSLALNDDDEKLMPLAQATVLPLVALNKADLLLTSSASSKANPNQKVWVVDPLLRPDVKKPKVKTLEAWLESLVVSLQSALIE